MCSKFQVKMMMKQGWRSWQLSKIEAKRQNIQSLEGIVLLYYLVVVHKKCYQFVTCAVDLLIYFKDIYLPVLLSTLWFKG